MSEVKIQLKIKLPLEQVFDVFTNHESYQKIPLVLNTRLLKQGDLFPSNGKNAVREIRFVGGSLKEVVIDLQYPLYWDYLFLKWPLPIQHLGGRMQFEPIENGTLLTWSTRYNSARLPKVVCKSIDYSTKVFLLFAARALAKIALERV